MASGLPVILLVLFSREDRHDGKFREDLSLYLLQILFRCAAKTSTSRNDINYVASLYYDVTKFKPQLTATATYKTFWFFKHRQVNRICFRNSTGGLLPWLLNWGRSPRTETKIIPNDCYCMPRHTKTKCSSESLGTVNSKVSAPHVFPAVIVVRTLQTLLSFYITVQKILDNKKQTSGHYFQSFWRCARNVYCVTLNKEKSVFVFCVFLVGKNPNDPRSKIRFRILPKKRTFSLCSLFFRVPCEWFL